MVNRASAVRATPTAPAAAVVARALRSMGVERAYGVMGAAVAHLASALEQHGIEVVHVRHESGAAFMALEDSLVSGRPGLVFTTTGPGCTNALTGLAAASWEGGRVIMLVGASNAEPNRTYFQHTTEAMVPAIRNLLASHRRAEVGFVDAEPAVHRALDDWHRGLSAPPGFVGVGLVPLHMQIRPIAEWEPPADRCGPPRGERERDAEIGKVLAAAIDEETVLWIGRGAAGAATGLARLVARTGARVMCTPRAKGVFPESHPNYLGVVGYAGHAAVQQHFADRRPRTVVILGSRLSEFSSFFDEQLAPAGQTFHVDIDATAFPCSEFLGPHVRPIEMRCEELVESVLEELGHGDRPAPPPRRVPVQSVGGPSDVEARVHPATLMAAVQDVVVDGSDAVVMTEAGDAFAWGTHALRFDTPGRYRVSTAFGAMGHATCGVVGAALARGGPAVAIVGDGAMMMNNEINTAAKHGVHAVWIVLNNATYGMIEHGMRSIGLPAMDLGFPRVDFAAVAEAMGGRGISVERGEELRPALRAAMAHRGPVVVDVATDASVPPPFGARNAGLQTQTGEDDRWRG